MISQEEAEKSFGKIDVLFLALPHGLSEKMTKKALENDVKVFDLGADFRLDDSETYENVKVGVLIQNVEKTEKYLKKYKYMHLKAGKNLVYNASDNSYYYNGSWAFNNDKAYPTVFDGK